MAARRITQADWHIINVALALHECEVEARCGTDEWEADTDDAREAQAELARIERVRGKVHERLRW